MRNLDVFGVKLLEVTELSVSNKLSPAVGLVLGTVLFIDQLLQWLDLCVVSWVEEVGNGKPFLLRVHHHPVLHALVSPVAPNLHKHIHMLCE